MQKYVVRRLLLAVPTLIGLTVMIFAIMRVLPGDPLVAYLDPNQMVSMSEAELDAIRKDHGLDRPLVVQYAEWMGDVLNGSFGNAMFGAKAPVINTIKTRGVTSAEIGIVAVAISWIIGLPVGIISAVRPGSLSDMFTSFTTVLFLAIPGFWLALLILLATVTYWGYAPPRVGVPLWEDPWNHFQIVIFPAFCNGRGDGRYYCPYGPVFSLRGPERGLRENGPVEGDEREPNGHSSRSAQCVDACTDTKRCHAGIRVRRISGR